MQIAKYVRSHYPNAYIQFQTNTTESSSVNIQGDADIANSAGAFSVEWYANNSADPAYQSIFASFQKNVDSRTCLSGCTTSTQPPSQPLTLPPTNPISQGSTPTSQPGGTRFSVTVCPHGLGNCGDNVNPTSGGNISPIHTQRSVSLTVLNTSGQPVATAQGAVNYSQSSHTFQGVLSVTHLVTGTYLAQVKLDGFLSQQLPGISTVSPGQTITLPLASLVTGDINNDNQLDILDYNILVSCFGSKQQTSSCTNPPTQQSPGSDLTDDGKVDGVDYNIFLRELSVQPGR